MRCVGVCSGLTGRFSPSSGVRRSRTPRAKPRLTGGALMVELILSEGQLACLKAAVTVGSEEAAALGRGTGLGAKLFNPEPFAVKCTRAIAI